jgi:DNA repair protein RecN (Recombination protein N)
VLQSLSIRNFAIIDRLDMEFAPGLTAITGETGAGKSIVIDALNLVLGGRADAEMVRAGADRAVVDATFDVAGQAEARSLLDEMGFETEEERLLISREVGAAGRSSARIGGRPATVAQLREIGDWLVDLHGQHEHQSLLAASRHIDLMDDWAGRPVLELRAEVGRELASLRRLEAERAALLADARDRAQRLDLYTFQVREIRDASLAPGEDELLSVEHRRVANAQRLAEAAAAAASALAGDDSGNGVLTSLAQTVRLLEDPARIDPALDPLLETIRSATLELNEAERDLARYQDSVELDPERLQQIEDRLELIRSLKRKYGDTIEEILRYGQETQEKLEALSNSEERGEELDSEIAAASGRVGDLCARLSVLRRDAAAQFEQATLRELQDLGMERARFAVQIEPEAPGPKGADRVEFLISTNPGEPLRPLARVASGGEISRTMLAVKSAMSGREPVPTMVFDEIDVGIGGRTASVVAAKLAALAGSAQILCITHLAQIASRAGAHLRIEKRESAGRTVVSVACLSPEERVFEVARMIAGTHVTETVLQHAREMLGGVSAGE